MDPITASILLGAATNVAGFGLKKLMGANRPEYEIPESARQALAQARILQADKNMPGEQKALEQVGISSANATQAASQGGNVLEAISAIQGQQDRATQGVLARSEEDQRNDQQRLMQQLGIMSQYEDQKFQMNEFAPYAENQQETRDLVGALSTNASNALLHQGLKGAGGGVVPGTENEAIEGVQPASEEIGEYSRMPTPSLLSQPAMGSVTSDGGKLPAIPYSVTTNAESDATEYDKLRYLLDMLKKSPQPYPY